jgi:hypothetical protein
MTLRQFLHDYRDVIDAAIHAAAPGVRLSDQERRMWVLNDEGLYRLALAAGVRL